MTQPPPIKRKRSFLKSWLFWSLTLLLLLLIAAGGSYFLAKRVPDWYRPLDPHNKDVQMAAMRYHDIDSRVQAKQLEVVSPGKPVTIEFREEIINSLLVVSMASKPEARVESPVILFQNGQVTIGARVNNLPVIGSGVLNFSLHFVVTPPENPAADPATRVAVILDSASVGSLPIPRSTLLSRLPDLAPAIDNAIKLEALEHKPQDRADQIADFLRLLAAEKSAPVPYLYPGGQNGKSIRPVFLQSIHIADHVLSLTFAAEPLTR